MNMWIAHLNIYIVELNAIISSWIFACWTKCENRKQFTHWASNNSLKGLFNWSHCPALAPRPLPSDTSLPFLYPTRSSKSPLNLVQLPLPGVACRKNINIHADNLNIQITFWTSIHKTIKHHILLVSLCHLWTNWHPAVEYLLVFFANNLCSRQVEFGSWAEGIFRSLFQFHGGNMNIDLNLQSPRSKLSCYPCIHLIMKVHKLEPENFSLWTPTSPLDLPQGRIYL